MVYIWIILINFAPFPLHDLSFYIVGITVWPFYIKCVYIYIVLMTIIRNRKMLNIMCYLLAYTLFLTIIRGS